jgi:hypothetical protein
MRGHSWLQIMQINLMMSFAGFNFQAKKGCSASLDKKGNFIKPRLICRPVISTGRGSQQLQVKCELNHLLHEKQSSQAASQ